MQPETRFKNRIAPILKKLPNSWFEKIQQTTIRGTPDMLGCVAGHFVALELKVPPNAIVAGSLQDHARLRIGKARGLHFEVTPDNWPLVYERLRRLAEGME